MATQTQKITSTSAALAPSTALVVRQPYALQNVGNQDVRLAEAASDPGVGFTGHVLKPGQTMTYRPRTGLSLWLWTISTDSYVAITEED